MRLTAPQIVPQPITPGARNLSAAITVTVSLNTMEKSPQKCGPKTALQERGRDLEKGIERTEK
jgi:hypothetical protein